MRTATPPLRRLVSILAVVAVVLPLGATGADAEIGDTSAQVREATEPEAPRAVERPLPDELGVDLAGLGYDGPVVDVAVIDRIAAQLPDDPRTRVVEIAHRLDLAPDTRRGLAEASTVLHDAVDDAGASVQRLRDARVVAGLRDEELARRAVDARSRIELLSRTLDEHRQNMADVAVAAYMSPPDADVLRQVLSGHDATTDELAAGVLFAVKADHDGMVRDDLVVATALAKERLERADRSAAEAAARVVEVTGALADVEARRAQLRRATDYVDGALAAVEARIPDLEEDLEATIQSAWPIVELPGMNSTDVPLVSVHGITVHEVLAPGLQALLVAAHAEGVMLGGWGHRTIEQQIVLRRAHCGPTPEDIYLKPASACSPPTAQPGSSLHERGLAIDFHLAGQSISTRESPGFQWLAANAATYGLYNLPSEPWHWSTNGA